MLRVRRADAVYLLVFAHAMGGCVPGGPPTADAGPRSVGEAAKPKLVPSLPPPPPLPTPAPSGRAPATSTPLGARFDDDFERVALGSNWNATSNVWHIDGGRLCGKGARNHGVWLARNLPTNVRIEFDAVSQSPDGDLKAEFFGDGASAASGVSYNDATSYLTIFGGWKNTFHVLARLNEHGADRMEIKVDPQSADGRQRPVLPGQMYHFKVERQNGAQLSWWIGDKLMFQFTDPSPLAGAGHDHFGFNDWDVEVCFDNVKIAAL